MMGRLKRVSVYVAAVLAVIVFYFVYTLIRSSGGVPEVFSEARIQGALIAQGIVETSLASAKDVEMINKLDKEGRYKEALELVAVTLTKTQEIRNQAVQLSAELEKMTLALSDLNSPEAQRAALEAISNHLALISRLVNYSGYLGQLLEVLQSRFNGNLFDRSRVSELVNQANAEVIAINNFNREARQAMERFDELVK